jgi:flagellar biosynthesis protein FlhB
VAGERTEKPTPKRRRKARSEGNVARSAELVASVVLLGVLSGLPTMVPRIGQQLSDFMLRMIAATGEGAIAPDGLGELAHRSLTQVAIVAWPILGLIVAGALASNLAQVGWHFSPGQLQPKLSRVDPFQGIKRLANARSFVELLKGFVKVSIVASCGWRYCSQRWEDLYRLSEGAPQEVAGHVGELAYGMARQMAVALAVIAALDYAYQKWQLERSLRMTKQEVSDELRESEGNPEVKARLRQRQREAARRRMMTAVPEASVVITNPTHFAVALQYEMGQPAPTVVAKGQDLIAQRIREIAVEHGVPQVENPPLARSLYKAVEVGDMIPPELYHAVAEVLALVWRLNARRTGRQAAGLER